MKQMSELNSPLFTILTQIDIAANTGLHLLAISMAVALPDICVSLSSDDGRSDAKKYKKWCADNLKTGFDYLTPDDLYSMRCGVLHSGRFGDLMHNVDRVIFVPPGRNVMIDSVSEDAYLYSVVEFCRNITRAVVAWYEANHTHPLVQGNCERLMQYHPDGIPPHVTGPVIG